jgi:hypothetical protein
LDVAATYRRRRQIENVGDLFSRQLFKMPHRQNLAMVSIQAVKSVLERELLPREHRFALGFTGPASDQSPDKFPDIGRLQTAQPQPGSLSAGMVPAQVFPLNPIQHHQCSRTQT